MVNGTLLNFDKRYGNNLRVIFDQWLKLHLGLDALSNQKILKGIYYLGTIPILSQHIFGLFLTHTLYGSINKGQ